MSIELLFTLPRYENYLCSSVDDKSSQRAPLKIPFLSSEDMLLAECSWAWLYCSAGMQSCRRRIGTISSSQKLESCGLDVPTWLPGISALVILLEVFSSSLSISWLTDLQASGQSLLFSSASLLNLRLFPYPTNTKSNLYYKLSNNYLLNHICPYQDCSIS